MILTDYFRSTHDATWDFALQSGVRHGVIRLPETADFDLTDPSHWQTVYDRFTDFGIQPLVIEPMPNEVHDHIKAGDELRDACIERVLKMFPIMQSLGINTICFNWMAHIGWLRTSSTVPERGGARVTEFKMADFTPTGAKITADELWSNYEYFIKAVIPDAEKYGIKLALHPDDPPVPRLGDVERIMISRKNIRHAVNGIVKSDSLGITMCQANYYIMGEDLEDTIKEFADRIYLVHFRNTVGELHHFRETFHDNGAIDMAQIMRVYKKYGVDVPIRVDHVPTMAGETSSFAGYDAMGRLFAIGYLKGILEANDALNTSLSSKGEHKYD
ncbi:MAG: mannonate dehydratase [Clostridia bacterium]|nr:mannonate dehydratase [Clostridia bacterium]